MNVHAEYLAEVAKWDAAEIERLESELKVINGPEDTGDDSVYNVRRLRSTIAKLTNKIGELKIERDSCRASNDAMHPRLVRCEETLVRVREMMQSATMTKPSYAAEIRRDARLAVAEINKALGGSAETPKLFTREQVRPLVEALKSVAMPDQHWSWMPTRKCMRLTIEALAKAKELGL